MVFIDSPLWIYVNYTEYFMSLVDTMFTSKHHVMKITSPIHTYMRICPHTHSGTWREYALIQTIHNDCMPFWGAICCITELTYKKHILQLSCRHPEGEVGGVPRNEALPEDLHASSARPIGCSDELILIRRCLIGRAALRNTLTWVIVWNAALFRSC